MTAVLRWVEKILNFNRSDSFDDEARQHEQAGPRPDISVEARYNPHTGVLELLLADGGDFVVACTADMPAGTRANEVREAIFASWPNAAVYGC